VVIIEERFAANDITENLTLQVMQRMPMNQRRHATVILIGDKEYWGPVLAGRSPLRRDYLAQLIDRLDQADASLIALDLIATAVTLTIGAEFLKR